jgi:Ca2+-binding EF-hand superfamily protein
MKLKLILAMLVTLGIVLAGSAYAEHEMGHGEMFKEADTNNDGKVSFDEFKAQHEKHMNEMFKRLDTNGDGFIDEAERKAGHDSMNKNCKMPHKKMDSTPPAAK